MKDRKKPRISVILPTRNRRELLEKTLKSIFDQRYPKTMFETIVVDDASNDETWKMLDEFKVEDKGYNLEVIRLKNNKGVSHARNAGIKRSNGEIIATIDDDCVADKNWLKTIDAIYSKDESLKSVGVRLVNSNPNSLCSRFVYRFHILGINTGFKPVNSLDELKKNLYLPIKDCFVHGCMACHNSVKKEVFQKTGYFNENYPKVAGSEDIEYNLRFNRDYKMYYTTKTYIVHEYSQKFSRLIKQFFNYGRGSGEYRKTSTHSWGGKTVLCSVRNIMYCILGIASVEGKNQTEYLSLVIIGSVAQLSLLGGGHYQSIRTICKKTKR
ncbi:MAG: glycosyltransferase [Candidatus Altiarchaeota archaeon]|nr:glycosyltransferase [Candidatus Altiarchaeota archaeon]